MLRRGSLTLPSWRWSLRARLEVPLFRALKRRQNQPYSLALNTFAGCGGALVVDLHALRHKKQQDLEQVRYEIEALRTVISLLEDPNDQPCSAIVFPMHSSPSPAVDESSKKGMADLETYYPFTRLTGTS